MEYYDKLLNHYQEQDDIFKDYYKLLECFKNNDYVTLDEFRNFNEFIDWDMIIQLEDFWHYRDGLDQAILYLKKCTSLKISEIVVDGLFKDSLYNVWINIQEMLRYLNSVDSSENLLTEEKIKFYQYILAIDKIKNVEKISMYQKLKDKNIALMFYQDWSLLKRHSYTSIINNLLKIEDKKYKVSVYELNGQDFYMMVSCKKIYKEISRSRRFCCSLISSDNMEVYDKNSFIYGYIDFDVNNICHVLERNACSSDEYGSSSFSNKYVNRIMTLRQLCNTSSHSEIQIVNKRCISDEERYETIKPSYLVVFDSIEEKHINEAERLNIPIVKINTSLYLNKINPRRNLGFKKLDNILEVYTNGKDLEKEKRLRR